MAAWQVRFEGDHGLEGGRRCVGGESVRLSTCRRRDSIDMSSFCTIGIFPDRSRYKPACRSPAAS
uniref:Uncharacterized protein n=1 Tax=Oryza barthii TaxID=65489 RepID=A0A0D3HCT6_9ORYZ